MSSNGPRTDSVIVDVTIAAPVGEVWQALRDPELLKNWFGWDADALAEEIQFIFFDHGTPNADNTVLQFGEYMGTSDRFELVAMGDKTRLRIVRSGTPPEEGWGNVYDDMVEGWINFVEQLRLLLEKHPGETRRTVYLSGMRTGTGPLPRAALGFSSSGALGAHAGELPTGDRIEGVVWHRSNFQTGVTVTGWNEALLIVLDKPGADGAPGGGSLILTTFGLDEVAFAALEGRLRTWWQANYPPRPAG